MQCAKNCFILAELESFYSNLCKAENDCCSSVSFFSDTVITSLSEELRSVCEGQITYNECFSVLQTFQKNKTPGNDGLSLLGFPVFC